MFNRFFFWRPQGKEARALALRSEIMANELNALPLNEDKPERDIVAILYSTCALLERLQEHQTHQTHQTRADSTPPIQAAPVPPEEVLSPDIASPAPQPLAPRESPVIAPALIEPPSPTEAPAHHESEVLTPAAQDLIKLSDWVLLARAANVPVQPAVLNEIHRQIVKVLGKEGVILLNETGHCDYTRQAIVGTEPTDDPAQHECIASVVRPGYLFHDQVLRSQEVIVYVYA